MPGPSHKARELAWKYSKGEARLSLERTAETSYCMYIDIVASWLEVSFPSTTNLMPADAIKSIDRII